MNHNEFRIIVAFLLIGFILHRGFYTRRAQQSTKAVREQPKLGRASQIASVLALPAFLSTIIYIFIPSWMAWSSFSIPLWSRWLGVGVAVGGFGLLQWAQQVLGKNWSDAPKLYEEQELISSGPYRWIRHPIYTAFLLILGSLLLISANWFIGAMWIGMTLLDVTARMNSEEAMLMSQFGEQYSAYMGRTGRLFPRI